jgi:hypothetical protein
VSLRYPAGPVALTRTTAAVTVPLPTGWIRIPVARRSRLSTGPAYSLAEDVAQLLGSGPSGPATAWRPDGQRPASGRSSAASSGDSSDTRASGPSGRVETAINRPGRDHAAPDAAELSEDDRTVLTAVRDAIADGRLPAQPTGYAIYTHVMGGRGDKARAYRIREVLHAADDIEDDAGLRAVS